MKDLFEIRITEGSNKITYHVLAADSTAATRKALDRIKEDEELSYTIDQSYDISVKRLCRESEIID